MLAPLDRSPMQVLGIDRVLVATADMDDSVDRFEEVLGLSFGHRIDPADMDVANRTSSIGVEFVSGDEGSAVAEFVAENGPGLYALALEVADLEAAREHLAGRGIEPLESVDVGRFHELFYHPAAFEGVLLVLTEYDYDHPVEVATAAGPE